MENGRHSRLDDIFFRSEKIKDIKEELEGLIHAHAAEVGPYPDFKCDPDWVRYRASEEAGMYILFTAREHGKLIGYNGFFLTHAIQHAEVRQATQDVVFIEKDARGFGRIFIAWCDVQLKNLGAQVCYQHLKAKNNYGKMLEGMGYELMDLVFAKRLDREVSLCG